MSSVLEELRAIAADAGVSAWVHARPIGDESQAVSWRGEEPVALASLYKLPLAVAWAALVVDGALDPTSPVRLAPDARPIGVTGVAMLEDEVRLSQRDTVRLMLAISDNACADAVLGLVGRGRLAEVLAGLGLADVAIRHGATETLRTVQAETGQEDPALAERALASVEREVHTNEYDAAFASACTASALCRTLDVLWSRSGRAYELVRDAMGHQAWRQRIASGFPHDDVAVYGKTGTFGRLRHEAAVIRYPGERPIAVAVLTRSARAERHQPRVDAAIGALARAAVTPLRRADSSSSSATG